MPLYEYECLASGHHRFERIQKYTDPLPEACPVCGSPVRKLASSPAIQFKGSGFYITDYAKKSSTDAGKGGSKSDGAKGEGSKSEGSSGEGSKSEGSSSESKSEGSKSDSSKSESSKSESSGSKSDGASASSSTSAKSESKADPKKP